MIRGIDGYPYESPTSQQGRTLLVVAGLVLAILASFMGGRVELRICCGVCGGCFVVAGIVLSIVANFRLKQARSEWANTKIPDPEPPSPFPRRESIIEEVYFRRPDPLIFCRFLIEPATNLAGLIDRMAREGTLDPSLLRITFEHLIFLRRKGLDCKDVFTCVKKLELLVASGISLSEINEILGWLVSQPRHVWERVIPAMNSGQSKERASTFRYLLSCSRAGGRYEGITIPTHFERAGAEKVLPGVSEWDPNKKDKHGDTQIEIAYIQGDAISFCRLLVCPTIDLRPLVTTIAEASGGQLDPGLLKRLLKHLAFLHNNGVKPESIFAFLTQLDLFSVKGLPEPEKDYQMADRPPRLPPISLGRINEILKALISLPLDQRSLFFDSLSGLLKSGVNPRIIRTILQRWKATDSAEKVVFNLMAAKKSKP